MAMSQATPRLSSHASSLSAGSYVPEESQGFVDMVEERAADILHKLGHVAETLCMTEDMQNEEVTNRFSGRRVRTRHEYDENLQNIRSALSRSGSMATEGHWLVDSMWFNATIMMATLLNTLQMGLEADHPEWTIAWRICENIFTAIFLIEMLVKLRVFRLMYFSDRANQLDCVLAVLGVLDVWILAAVEGVNLQSLSILRILRLLRLARILRLVRRVKPLVLVIEGVMHALEHASYVFAVCIFVFYVFAIFLTEHLGKSNTEVYPGYSSDPEVIDEQETLANYNPYICFGNMMSSMLTLFNMATFTEWAEIVRPVAIKQPMYVPVFLFFALSVGFGVMNVLIGVIVDVVTAESKRIDTDLKDRAKKQKLATLDHIQEVLTSIDVNGDGKLDLNELGQALKSTKQLKALIAKINLPSGWSSNELLDMLDNSGAGYITHSEFTTTLFRLLDSDDFQQTCILQASINQVKHLLLDQNTYFGAMLSSIEHDTCLIKEALGYVINKQSSSDDLDGEGAVRTAAELRGHSAGRHRKKHHRKPNREQHNEFPGFTSHVSCDSNKVDEFISKMQLPLKECIQEECAAIKDCLASEVKCLRSGTKDSSADHCGSEVSLLTHPCLAIASSMPIVLPVGCSDPNAGFSDGEASSKSEAFRSVLSESMGNEASCADDDGSKSLCDDLAVAPFLQQQLGQESECQYYTHEAISVANAYSEPCQTLSSDEQFLATSTAANTGHQITSAQNQNNEHLHLSVSQSFIHDFVFEEDTQQLGFEVDCVKDGQLPLIHEVSPGGAANVQGMLQGDRLAECNGISLAAGQDWQEVMQLLTMRPLELRILRGRRDILMPT